jgi:iron complex outermembrane recepter protein
MQSAIRSGVRRPSCRRWGCTLVVLAVLPTAARAVEPLAIPVEPLRTEGHLPPQETAATPLDTIEVTGSRLRRSDDQTAQPVLTISRAEIERSGAQSIGEFLQKLPVAGSAANASVTNSEVGSIEIDLRNLGSERVLVLVNSRRWVGGMYFRSTGSVDLSTIPLSIIERIEILKDGASAIYGSDAIAGVVNIITRRDVFGLELRAGGAGYSQGDGYAQDFGLTWGTQRAGTSMLVDLAYREQRAIDNGDREITQFYRAGAGPTRGFFQTPRGTLLFVPTEENAAALGPELCPEDPAGGPAFCQMILRRGETIRGTADERSATVAARYKPFDSTSSDPQVNDLYDPNALFNLRYPERQANLFAAVAHDFAALRLQIEALYVRKELQQNGVLFTQVGDFAPERFDAIFIAADNAYNPFDQDIGRAGADGSGSGIVLKALSEAMPNVVDSTIDSYRLGLSLDGDLDRDARLQWQAGVVYAQSRNSPFQTGLNLERLASALGPDAQCRAQDGCVPLNLFGAPGAIDAEMLDYITYRSRYDKRQDLVSIQAGISGLVGQLAAGPLGLALGAEYRREAYRDTPDTLIVSCVAASCFPATSGSIEASEIYAEVNVPILADRPGIQLLDASVATRHARYSGGNEATTYKLGLRWKPADVLLLRATRSSAFRAPAISDLYLTPAALNLSLVDPCSDYAGAQGGAAQPESVQQRCREDGVPESYVQGATVPVRDGGNPALRPERADTWTAGLILSPARWPRLDIQLDVYRIDLDRAITLLDPQFLLDACYRESAANQTCAQITRDTQGGAIADLRFQPINIGGRRVEGVDGVVDLALPAWTPGALTAQLSAAYLRTDRISIIGSDGDLQSSMRQGRATATQAFPRWRASAELAWSASRWSAAWRVRYVSSMSERCDDGLVPSYTELGLCSAPDPQSPERSRNRLSSVVYHDVQLAYALSGGETQLRLGARNLLDRAPPASYSNLYNAFDASTYELPGTQLYASVEHRF